MARVNPVAPTKLEKPARRVGFLSFVAGAWSEQRSIGLVHKTPRMERFAHAAGLPVGRRAGALRKSNRAERLP